MYNKLTIVDQNNKVLRTLKVTSVIQFIQKNQRSNICKKKKRNSYEPHQQTTTTEEQALDLIPVNTIYRVLNVLNFYYNRYLIVEQ